MRGAKVLYKKLGRLLREGRERQKMSLKDAALVLGLTNEHYLWRCEDARWANFPAAKLRRALDLYKIPPADAVAAMSEDFRAGMLAFLKAKQ